MNTNTSFLTSPGSKTTPTQLLLSQELFYGQSFGLHHHQADLKLDHYMKAPPRIMYTAQLFATLISYFVVVGVQRWTINNIESICVHGQKNGFSYPFSTTFAQASIPYGGVGPGRLFAAGSTYVCFYY